MSLAKTIPVSFKNSEKDIYLYDEIQKQRDKSNFIKECVEFYLKYKENNIKIVHLDNR